MNQRVTEKINSIGNDRLHGASWLSQEAIVALKLAIDTSQANTIADFVAELKAVARELVEAKPGMASIANYVSQFVYEIITRSQKEKDLTSLKSWARAKGKELIKFSEAATAKASQHGAQLISNSDILITCSYSSTVCHTLNIAKKQGKDFRVIIAESKSRDGRAYGEMTAERLQQHGIPVEIIPDEEIERHISKATKTLVGADSILSDGSVINGTPTRSLASAAKNANIPFYSVCETAKFDIRSYGDKEPTLEEGFDQTPPSLITGIITEDGILDPSQVINYIGERKGHWQLLTQP